MAKIGRPSKRTPEVIERIVSGLSAGTPLTVICDSDDMPADRTVREWAEKDEELSAAIARARDAGFDRIAVEALSIIDAEPERVVSVSEDGERSSERIDSAAVQWAKNRAELRLKLLAKWDPKRYGDKAEIDHKSSDGTMTPKAPVYKITDK